MTPYRLPEQLDIRRIVDAQQQLQAVLSAADGVEVLDASAVTRIDTTGVQLLVAALQGRSGGRITLGDPAPCVIEAFEALGLDHLLNLPD